MEADAQFVRSAAMPAQPLHIQVRLTEDTKHAGYWDAQKKAWQPFDDESEVKKALAVARGDVQPELLELPVRAAEPAK